MKKDLRGVFAPPRDFNQEHPYQWEPNLFEAYDGGHCYIRVHRRMAFGEGFAFSRCPNKLTVKDLQMIAAWAEGTISDKATLKRAAEDVLATVYLPNLSGPARKSMEALDKASKASKNK